MKINTFIIIIGVHILYPVCSCNSNINSQAQLKFETDTINLGTLKCDTVISINCKYKNIGGVDLIIKNINTSCDCLVSSFKTIGVKENQEDSFSISYHTAKEQEGVFMKIVSILSNSKKQLNTLYIKANLVKNK